MSLNKSTGNMYEWITHTWGCMSGCPHQCSYCYAKAQARRWGKEWSPVPKLASKFPDLGGDPTVIFVCHTSDLFAEGVPDADIMKVLDHCRKFPENRYVIQTKNPERIVTTGYLYSPKCCKKSRAILFNPIIGCTIETNRNELAQKYSSAPRVTNRAAAISQLHGFGFETFVTIEPVLDFDLQPFAKLLEFAKPDTIYVGADSKVSGLEEPSCENVVGLVNEFRSLKRLMMSDSEVKLKPNIARIVGEEWYLGNR